MNREISCRITNSIVKYVRDVHNAAVDQLLDDLPVDEAYLCDVHNWISHDLLQTLYQRMVTLLDDPDAVYKMTLASERFQPLGFLDRVVRLLGNPKFLYDNTYKYNRLLKTCGDVFVRESGPAWVVLEDCYHDGRRKTRYDCDYTRGILAGLPTVFGLPLAHVEELRCQVSKEKYGVRNWPDNPEHDGPGCLYRVHFGQAAKPSLWYRLFRRAGIYHQAIEDLLEANRTIQEKYNQVIQLAEDLDTANQKLRDAKQRLEASENKYRLLAEHASDIIWTFDLSTMSFDYVSPSVWRLRGYRPEETTGKGMEEILTPRSIENVIAILHEELALEGQPGIAPDRHRQVEVEAVHRNGSIIWLEASMSFIRDVQGHPKGVLGTSRDMTQRKIALQALNAEKERLSVTLNSIADGVIAVDQRGIVTLLNPVAADMTGWLSQAALGRPSDQVVRLVDPQSRVPQADPISTIIQADSGGTLSKDALLISQAGGEAMIAYKGAPLLDADSQVIGAVMVFRDITQHHQMAKEHQKVEKLESLGMLAGGIAHDFNNFLAGIVGNLSLAKLEVASNDRAQARLADMEKAALHARNLTQQLLTFAKGGDPVVQTVALTDLVCDAARFVTRGANVRCEFNINAEHLYADVDEGQIVQVIHNLMLNAQQAMPQGGIIRVGCHAATLTAQDETTLHPGAYVRIVIQDHGSGIDVRHLKNIFDPYFTTKRKGSGLGLAVAHAVIEKHNGRISVNSVQGIGTTFTIHLPRVAPPRPAPVQRRTPLAKGSGRILIMDDEPLIRKLLQEMLNVLGYEVVVVASGEAAVAGFKTAKESGGDFDAVILDLTVQGGMGGKETIKQLLAIDPNVKAIVSSGYSTDPVLADHVAYGFQVAIRKPYRIEDMAQALKKLMG